MANVVIDERRDLKDIIELKKDGYRLLSISSLGGRKDTIQYSLINHEKSLVQHFLVDTFNQSVDSLDKTYYNANIFEFEVNQNRKTKIINDSKIPRKWNISPDLHSMNFTFNFEISNRLVENITVNPGFSYRTIEKNLLFRAIDQIPNFLAKICGLCSTGHTLSFCLLVEKMMGISDEIPEITNLIRILFAEIERMGNHLLWIGLSTLSSDLKSVSTKILDLRNQIEKILNEIITAPSLNTIGGVNVNFNVLSTLIDSIEKFEIELVSIENDKDIRLFKNYTSDVAVLNNEDEFDYGCLGPISRSIGMGYDARKNFPYSGYKSIEYLPVSSSKGDLWALFKVKWKEIMVSYEVIREILNNTTLKEIKPIKTKEVSDSDLMHSHVEAPNGLLQYTGKISQGKLDQLHIAVPSINNLIPTIARSVQSELQNIPLILRSIDMGYDPNDKLVFFDLQSKKTKEITGYILQKKANKSLQKDGTLNFSDL